MKALYHLNQKMRKIIVERQLLTFHYKLMERISPVMAKVPKDKEKAVIFSFDVETFTNARVNEHKVKEEYEVFMPRLLEVLDSYNIKAQFFVCGKAMELYSESIYPIVQKNHNLGGHGYMHEKMTSLSEYTQKEIINKVKAIAKNFFDVDIISWRSPYLASNFGTYKALSESGLKLSSSTLEVSWPVCIKGIIEVPLVAMDGDILGYFVNGFDVRDWIDFMKKSLVKLDKGILVFGMHTWFQMRYDSKLTGLQEFLSWIEPFREEVWIGSLDEYYQKYVFSSD